VKILDNEWRWENPATSWANPLMVVESGGRTDVVDNHLLDPLYLPSYLVGSYSVSKQRDQPVLPIEGPNSVLVDVDGTWKDGGLFGWTAESAGRSQRLTFDYDKETGVITQRQGAVSDGYRRLGRCELLYLLAWPDGNRHGLRLTPEGIIIFDVNVSKRHPDCRYWVYVSSAGGPCVRPVEVDPSCPPVAPADLAELEQSRLWTEFFRPALIEESQRFDHWWVETQGSPNFTSRFTSKATFDAWIAEREAKVKAN